MDDDFFAQEEEKNMNVMLSRNDKGVAEHPDENRKKTQINMIIYMKVSYPLSEGEILRPRIRRVRGSEGRGKEGESATTERGSGQRQAE